MASSIVCACLLAGCAKDGPTLVSGEVALAVDALTAPTLVLPPGTTLPSQASSAGSGLVAGECIVAASATEIELERTSSGAVEPTGFVWFQLRVDSPEAPHVGHVMAEYDGAFYEADCDLTRFERNRGSGFVAVDFSGCSLLTPAPGSAGVDTVTASASLTFDGCVKR